MPRPLAAISRRKTLPLSVITPSIWTPAARSPYWQIVRARLLNERAPQLFHEIGNGIAVGILSVYAWGVDAPPFCHDPLTLYLSLFFSYPQPHERTRLQPYIVPGWCEIPRRHWFAWAECFIVYAPIKHSIWLHPRTHTVNPLSLSLFLLYPHFVSLIYINKIKFPVCLPVLSLTASRENDSTDSQWA